MSEERATEDAQDVVKRLKKLVEAECGPIFISKMQMRELVDLYKTYKKEYGQDFASEEIQNRIKSQLQ
ncbi:MAG: hypothetical protein LUQ34_04165 [Euryarchaeota archaeon]|nr:hypothetical protein [Euryarchaeota archaeon]